MGALNQIIDLLNYRIVLFVSVPWFGSSVLPANCLQVTSATNGSAAECTIVEEEPWKHE